MVKPKKCAKTQPAPIELSDSTDVSSQRQIPAWNIILRKLDFQSQMKLTKQNQWLEDLVRENAEYELQKFRRHIKDNKYIARKNSNPENWAMYRALIWIFEDLNCNPRTISQKPNQSSIAILAKAEILAAKLNGGRWSESQNLCSEEFNLDEWKDIESFFKIKIGNKDWKLKIVAGEKARDGQKLSIYELATGKKNFEEWDFLPKNWDHYLSERMIVLEDNFIALIFDDHMFRPRFGPYGTSWNLEGHGRGDLLILNLATRKNFWMKRSQIENQMKAKVYEKGGNGARYDYDRLRVNDSMIHEMNVGTHEIKIKYRVDYRYGTGFLMLESFIELKLEEGDIYDYEIPNVKLNSELNDNDWIGN